MEPTPGEIIRLSHKVASLEKKIELLTETVAKLQENVEETGHIARKAERVSEEKFVEVQRSTIHLTEDGQPKRGRGRPKKSTEGNNVIASES